MHPLNPLILDVFVHTTLHVSGNLPAHSAALGLPWPYPCSSIHDSPYTTASGTKDQWGPLQQFSSFVSSKSVAQTSGPKAKITYILKHVNDKSVHSCYSISTSPALIRGEPTPICLPQLLSFSVRVICHSHFVKYRTATGKSDAWTVCLASLWHRTVSCSKFIISPQIASEHTALFSHGG